MSLSGVPRIAASLLDRPRLHDRFESSRPLVVAHAPIGYGKTVAMAEWATRTAREGVWLRIPDGISDPMAFVYRLAVEIVDAGFIDGRNPLATAAATLPYDSDPWDLLARGMRQLPEGFTIALDDSDRLSDATLEGLVDVLADIPGLSIRATTRRWTRMTEPALAVLLDADVLTAEHLALTPDEAIAIVGDEARARAVVDAGGAPALARAIALGAFDADLRGAVESLLRLRVSVWDERFVDFVQRASLADSVDVEQAAELSGASDAAELLDIAEREGLGSWNAPAPRGGRARFVFSPFLRTVAVEALRDRIDSQELRALILRIARRDFLDGRVFPALRGAVETGDWALANDVVREHWYELLPLGKRVRELFHKVPVVTLRSWPLITMLLAIIANARGEHRLRALEYFALAAYGSRRRRAAFPAEGVLLRGVESAAHRVSGNLDRALAAATDAERMLATMTASDLERLSRTETSVHLQMGLAFFYADDSETALRCFRRAVAVADAKGYWAGVQGLALIAGVLATDGDIADARPVVAEADGRTWPDGWRAGYPGSFFQLARTFLALELGDVDAADAALRTLDRHRSTIEHWPVLTHVDVMILLMRGRADDALQLLDSTVREQRRRHTPPANVRARLRHTRALALLAHGDRVGAEREVAKAPPGIRADVARARIALADGDPHRAQRLLHASPAPELQTRLRAEHLALSTAASALVDPKAEHVRAMLARLDVMLADRGLLLPLVTVPVTGLDAIGGAAPGSALADRVAAARAFAVVSDAGGRPRLTPRELAVARELGRATSTAEIAAALVVSPNTVKTQLRSLYRKLGVGSRPEALRALAAWGVTEEPPA